MIKSILNSISVRNQKRGLRLVQLVSLKRITKKGTVLAEVDSHQIVIENFGSSSPIAYCSCPFGGPGHCEHIAAVCYHLKEMETKGFDFGSCNNLSHYKYCKETAKNSFHFGSSENWFEIVISCSFGLENVLLRTIVQTIKKGKNTIDLHNGTIGILPKKFTQTISKLLKFGKISGDRIQISKHHFNLLETIIQELKPVEYKKEITTETKLEITNRKTHLQYYLNTKTFEVPQEVKATLRPYQIEACSWLQYLNHSNYGGILADDMGLGKTLVVLTILSEQYRGNSTSSPLHERSEHSPLQSPYDRESKSKSSAKPNGPVISSSRHPVIVRSTGAPATISSSCSAQSHQRQSLIISPSTLIFNWQNEIKKFTPHLKTYTHYGPNRSSLKELDSSYDLIITSYGLVRREIAQFRNIHFNYIILDESQAIKNPNSQRFKAIQKLKGNHRIAMTGTPVENSTTDLYAQMQFANPGMLGSLASFKRNFVKPIEQESNQEIADYLERTLDPFILRRTKEQVAKELPPKTEDIIYCTMPNDQRKIYDYWKDHYSNKIKNQVQSEGITKSKIHILEAITKLRQICASPRLLDSNQDSSFYEWGGVADAPGVGSGEVGGSANAHEVGSGEGSLTLPEWGVESGEAFTLPMGKKTAQDEEQSVKINEILLHIQEKTGKHQLIIFSQFVKMLELIRTELEKIDIPYAWLTGDSTLKSRQENVNRFQNDNTCRVFLISLRAGGAGLNLTAADYVYILDPWWNPAVENQAIDRCYRIGQDKNVFAYRMICKDTIEEKILELQQRKQNLSGQVVKVDERELIELIIKKE